MQWGIRLDQRKYLFQCGGKSYALIDLQNLLENKSHVPLIEGNEHRLSLDEIANNLIGLHDTLFREQPSTVQECILIDFLAVRRLMKSAMPLHIVEIGATEGILSFHLASVIGQYNVESSLCCVCSVDDGQWLEKVSKVEKPPKLSKIIGEYNQTDLQPHKYDVVVLNGSEHFTDPDKIVMEAKRLVNSKGIIICLEKKYPLLSKKFRKRFPKNETFRVNPNTTVFYAESQKLSEENSDAPAENNDVPAVVKEMEDYLARIRIALHGGADREQLRIYYKELEKHIDAIMQTSLFELKTKLIDCQDEVLNAMYPAVLEEDMRGQQIVLSIGLLVSKGKETVQKCLESLTPIREQICCELIIMDTGCDADVRQMLAGYADILKDFNWCDDLSKARNECLKYASGEWFLYLDDDEYLAEPDELIVFFQSGEYREYGCASYIQRNFLDMEASRYTDTWTARMVKREDDTHFEGKIYVYLAPVRGKEKKLHSKVYHFGYVYPDEASKWEHLERNSDIIKSMLPGEQQSSQEQERAQAQLLRKEMEAVQISIARGDYEEAERLFQNTGISRDTEAYDDVAAILDASLGVYWGDRERVWEAIRAGLSSNCRNYELYVMLGNYYLEENLQQAYLCYENALHHCDVEEDRGQIQALLDQLCAEYQVCVNRAAFVVLPYDRLEYTRPCIESIRSTVPETAREIIVMDNGSEDGSVEWLRGQKDIKLVANEHNMGFPVGCSRGIAAADPDSDIFLLDNDTLMTENALFWLRMGLYAEEKVGAAGSVSNNVPNGQEAAQGLGDVDALLKFGQGNNIPMKYPYEQKPLLIRSALLIKRSVLDEIGMPDEQFSPVNSEDEDYGRRVVQAGFKNILCKNSFILHYGHKSL